MASNHKIKPVYRGTYIGNLYTCAGPVTAETPLPSTVLEVEREREITPSEVISQDLTTSSLTGGVTTPDSSATRGPMMDFTGGRRVELVLIRTRNSHARDERQEQRTLRTERSRQD